MGKIAFKIKWKIQEKKLVDDTDPPRGNPVLEIKIEITPKVVPLSSPPKAQNNKDISSRRRTLQAGT